MNISTTSCTRLLIVVAITVFVLTNQAQADSLISLPTTAPPVLDGVVSPGEWDDLSAGFTFNQSVVLAQHDTSWLYLLVDVTGDTYYDPPEGPPNWGDFFWMAFDVDRDAEITPDVDILYSGAGLDHITLQYYLAPYTFSFTQETTSQTGAAVGTSMHSQTPHLIHEFALDLAEINGSPGDILRMGLRNHSLTPDFDEWAPSGFDGDFASLHEITLLPEPSSLALLAPALIGLRRRRQRAT